MGEIEKSVSAIMVLEMVRRNDDGRSASPRNNGAAKANISVAQTTTMSAPNRG